MNHIEQYLLWRGDLLPSADNYSEIDFLIFSILSYTHLEEVEGDFESPHSIATWASKIDPLPGTTPQSLIYVSRVAIPNLIKQLSISARFASVYAHHFVHIRDAVEMIQFCAVTFDLDDHTLFVSFRGTDETLTGWKEDMQMSYSEEVPAQRAASRYLSVILSLYPTHHVYIGGHSKGGNLALYSSLMITPEDKSRILGIYNFDGPGLSMAQLSSLNYHHIKDRIHTIVPKSSMIGVLLEQASDYDVVDSDEVGPMQHDPFSWLIQGKTFIRENALKMSSLALKDEMRKFLSRQSPEERARFFDSLFAIIESSGATTLNDLLVNKRVMVKFAVNFLRALSGEERNKLVQFTGILVKAWTEDQADTIKNSIKKVINK